jgi:hypothetical protein
VRRALAIPLASLLLSLPGRVRAQEISLEEIAVTEREERAAMGRVEAAHGSKLPQEHSSTERVQIVREQQAASREVFEQRKLDPKAFARRVMRLSPSERAEVDAIKKRMDEEEQERLEREKAAAAAEPEELEITRGSDERRPVDLYREPGAVVVESLQEEGAAEPEKASRPARSAPPQKSSRGGRSRRK